MIGIVSSYIQPVKCEKSGSLERLFLVTNY